jgi:hypothetical protein
MIKAKRMRWAEHLTCMGEKRNTSRCLVGKPEGKTQLGKYRRRLEDNIKIDFREIEWSGKGWINLAQDRGQWRAPVNTATNFRVT